MIELLYALFIMCIFCVSAVSAIAPFSNLGKFKRATAGLEQKILIRTVFNIFSRKVFLKTVNDFKQVGKYNFPFFKLTNFLEIPSVGVFETVPQNSTTGQKHNALWLTWSEIIDGPIDFLNYIIVDPNLKSIKLRPVYTVKHMPSKYGSETWKNSKLIDFTTKSFENLCDQYRSGEVSRIYLVLEKS